MRLAVLHFTTALLCTVALAACAGGDPTEQSTSSAPLLRADARLRVPGQYIVVFKDAARSAASAAAERLAMANDGSRVLRAYASIPGLAAKLSDAELEAVRRDPEVAHIEEDQLASIGTIHASPADGTDRVDQRLGRDGLYDDGFLTGQGVHIYIIDTGIYEDHHELTNRVGAGYDFVDDDADPADCHGHGTHVASTAAGEQYGIAKQATLHGVRVLGCNGSGSYANVIAGVDHVVAECVGATGRCVANMSLGGGVSPALNAAVDNAVNAGIPFAVAAGNETTDACTRSPASAPAALTVGAVDDNDARAGFSNFGACVDLFAPGVTILGAFIGAPDATRVFNGTSMASPHAAGVLAQYLQANPNATPQEAAGALAQVAGVNCVADERGSPDLLLHNQFDAEPFDCSNPPGPKDTCEGFCGGMSDYGCYCDATCEQYGDCCPDKVPVCGP